jgi:predicted transcriptional regulator
MSWSNMRWSRRAGHLVKSCRCGARLSAVRDQIRHVLEELPSDATFEDAIERLVFLAKIDAGLVELDAGQGVPHDEVKRRLGL